MQQIASCLFCALKPTQYCSGHFQTHCRMWKLLYIMIGISLIFPFSLNNKLALVQVMAWCQTGEMPLFKRVIFTTNAGLDFRRIYAPPCLDVVNIWNHNIRQVRHMWHWKCMCVTLVYYHKRSLKSSWYTTNTMQNVLGLYSLHDKLSQEILHVLEAAGYGLKIVR